jgi:hypothetical protein
MQQIDGLNDDGTNGVDLYVDLPAHAWAQVEWGCDCDYPEPEHITAAAARGLVEAIRESGWRTWPESLPADPDRGRQYRSLEAMRAWDAWLDRLLAEDWAAPPPAWWQPREEK